jgi:MATE family multidrug resistance protein
VILGFEVTVFSAAGLLIGLLGAEVLAAHAVALQIASVAFMVPLGIGQAATVRVGLAAGRGERAGVARAGWAAFALGTGFMVTTAALMIAFPWTLVGLFLDLSDPAGLRVAELAVGFLAVAGLFQIADGAQVVGAGALRGLKDTRVPMLLAGFGYWIVGMPLGALLAFRAGLGGLGIWIGLATGLLVVAVLMAIRWSRRERLGLVDGLAPAP